LTTPAPSDSQEHELFYAGAYRRIFRTMLAISVVAVPVLWLRWRWPSAVGFVAGAAVSVVNFYWLKKTVEAFAEKVVNPQTQRRTPAVVGRFLLRYLLIAAAGYAIVKSSATSIYGFCGGLFLPVGAILIEAAYEAYLALRRESSF
jgi:ATP synthase I chain